MRWLIALLLVLATMVGTSTARAQGENEVILLTVEGPVTPAMGRYLERGLEEAEARDAELLVLRLDTPGGSTGVMRELVLSLSNATVPTMVYVWPPGAQAASAGTFVTLSADLAAMAPQTTIGAASVVGGGGEDLDETISAKLTNDLVAAIRSQTERRGEAAADWAERAITEAIAANANEALEIGIIDYIARDTDELLSQADGATVELASGEEVTLELSDPTVRQLGMTAIERLLHAITDPQIALLLVSLGGAALLYELYSPGGFVGGIFGVIATILGFYSLGSLDANWSGLALLGFAFVLFIVELQTATTGLFAAGGIASFIFGSLILFQSSYIALSLPALLLIVVGVSAFFLIAIGAVLRTRHVPPVTGPERLLGRVGEIRRAIDGERPGMIFVDGESWSAYAPIPIDYGQMARVVAVHGLHLEVEPVEIAPGVIPAALELEEPTERA